LLLIIGKLYCSENKLTIAIVDFDGKNMSAMDASVATDFLRTALVNSKYFVITDRDNMELILSEQGFQQTGCTTQDCAVKIGNVLNVQRIVIGNLSKLGKVYYVTANVVDVETGQIIISDRVHCSSQEELVITMEKLAKRIENKAKGRKVKEYKKVDREKLSIGLGYPYVSLLWNVSNKFGIEPRFATDFEEIYIAGSRFNITFAKFGNISAYYGVGLDYLMFAPDEDYISVAGIMAGGYIGGVYKINKLLGLNMDIGPYYISILENNYGVNVTGLDFILNMGLQLYLF
jgi:TolB-like protein